jgi:hypothetical protein
MKTSVSSFLNKNFAEIKNLLARKIIAPQYP